MVPAAIIATKRDGGTHTADEIWSMIDGFVDQRVADYQMAAWAMAIVCRGMTQAETTALTAAMLASGSRLPRASDRPRVDKHSTGGLGDSPSIVLAPLLACFDLDVPMLSGRGLGITGGTLDKLEAIPGFRCDLSTEEITRQLQALGCVITGTTPDIAPADRELYALRDVTGTVESIALITASIMSKKLAESLDALVLDIKFGSGAFMQTIEEARRLAVSLTQVGREVYGFSREPTAGDSALNVRALLTDMNQPLGRMVGNACEINEAVEILHGRSDSPLAEVTLRLGSELLLATKQFSDLAEAKQALLGKLATGDAFQRFEKMVQWQGGELKQPLALAPDSQLLADESGYVTKIDGRKVGQAIIELGGGRKAKQDPIDHSVGIEMLVRIGDAVGSRQPLVRIFASSEPKRDAAHRLLQQSITLGPNRPSESSLILPL